MLKQKQITQFQKEILNWYKNNKRDLPWRKTRDPYKILVSEIMLQQTQVNCVIPKYEAWVKTFPTIGSLARAKTSDVLRLWSGLGYNRRALYLKKIAVILSETKDLSHMRDSNKLRDSLPSAQNDIIRKLKKLPGIGEYTARAVACFAFDQEVAVVDTNIRKIILLKFYARKASPFKAKIIEIQKIADQLLPKGKAYDWNHALMDYASSMLKKERIPIPKQSKFIGSHRYYRGQIIKLLVEKEKITVDQLVKLLDKDENFLKKVVDGLSKDGFVSVTKESIFLLNS